MNAYEQAAIIAREPGSVDARYTRMVTILRSTIRSEARRRVQPDDRDDAAQMALLRVWQLLATSQATPTGITPQLIRLRVRSGVSQWLRDSQRARKRNGEPCAMGSNNHQVEGRGDDPTYQRVELLDRMIRHAGGIPGDGTTHETHPEAPGAA